MRLALPVHYFPPRYIGGAERYTLGLAHGLKEVGFEVVVVAVETLDGAPLDGVVSDLDVYEGIEVHRLSLPEVSTTFARSCENPAIGEWFQRFFVSQRIDLAHFQGAYRLSASALFAAYRASIPTIITLHDYWFVCPKLTLLRNDRSLCEGPHPDHCIACCCMPSDLYPDPEERLRHDNVIQMRQLVQRRAMALHDCLLAADALIAPSEFLRESYIRLGVPAARLKTVRLGLFRSQRTRKTEAPRGPLRISYVSHLLPHKGADVLVDALSLLRPRWQDLSVSIYGATETSPAFAGRLRTRLQDIPCARLMGGFQPEELWSILSHTDVVVVPSLWFENSPLVILEALAAGVPVIASDCGAIPEFVRDRVNGLLFERGEPSSLAAKISECIDDGEALTAMSAAARYTRTTESEVAELLAIYDSVLMKSRRVGSSYVRNP